MDYIFSENQWGEKYLEHINRADFSNTRSADLFKQIFGCDLEEENHLFIVSGSDSGLLLPWLSRQNIGRGSHVAVIELDDVYALVEPEYRGLLSCDRSTHAKVPKLPITFHKFSTWQDELFDGSEQSWIKGGIVKLLESNASSADYSRRYTSMHHAIGKCTQWRVTHVLINLNSRIFSKVQFRNSVDSIEPLKINTAIGRGKTAVVLGGGPSLDLHFNWIKQNRERIFILAVSRIANKLLKEELKPDLVVSVDPQDFSYEVSKQGVLWTDVPLAYNYHVSAKLLQQWQGPAFYMGRRLPWHSEDQTKDCVPASGPTVSHTAIIVASHLGFSQILLTGVDMCFSVSASTHANDSPEKMIQKLPTLCNAQVETYTGRIAGTDFHLKNGVQALELIGSDLAHKNMKLYNLNEEAAYCSSISYIATSDVVLPEEKPILAKFINLDVRSITEEELDKLEKEFKLARWIFSKIRTTCAKAKSLVAQIHGENAVDDTAKISSRLAKLRKQIETEYPEYIGAVTYHYAKELSKTDVPIDFNDMSAEELVGWGQHYYNLVERGATSLIKEIDAQIPRLQLRRDELDVNIDVRQLAKRWRDDETAGRIMRWRRLHGVNAKPEDRAWIQRSIGKFRATLNAPTAKTSKYYRSRNEDIDNVLRSLVFLAQNESIAELQAIESRFDSYLWPYSALKPFTAGLVHVLQNDLTLALGDFQRAIDVCTTQMASHPASIDSMKRLLEECLVRLNSCYVNTGDYQSALTSLGVLCEMCPSYIVSYAKMLDLSGQRDYAIELLQSYVELYSSNKKAQFLLSKLLPKSDPTTFSEKDPVYKEKIGQAIQAIMGR
ncbi:DUF115 domain-containing protein [Granulosicoccus sp.]|nr:DUF115 domain-containing protein [Granulosicoccus sp.]